MLCEPLKYLLSKIISAMIMQVFTTVVLGYVLYRELFPPTARAYIPKRKRWMVKLKALEYSGYLLSWVKASWQQRHNFFRLIVYSGMQ
jgi:hypothetical protein